MTSVKQSAGDACLVHPTAIVDEGAQIGKGVQIWHFSHVMCGARIGDLSKLGQNVFVDRDVFIGRGVKIQNNVSVYRGVTLEDDVFAGPSVVFTNVCRPRSAFPRKVEEYGKTHVGKGATLGANATIVCGITIGEHAFIGAGSVVTRDVPPFALMVGVPARRTGWVCACGTKLSQKKKAGQAECPACSRHYDINATQCRLI
ncbi:MAG: acyltransferase [Candidatus Omnitrophica bacterium]|nr:acyltransferase [Candidatus Omnitrophota bacterium]MDD5672504.1 acyltransferase [Candidatus Omnitrophota bacterium]